MPLPAELAIVTAVTVYIVDVSGFTDAWRSLLARWLHVKELRPLPPFDCGVCMTWWCCLIWAVCHGHFDLPSVGLCALCALLASPVRHSLITLREGLNRIIGKIQDLFKL